MKRLISTLPIFMATMACEVTVHEHDHDEYVVPVQPIVEEAPFIEWADAGCFWSSFEGDFLWWFQADVFDANGFEDVSAVYADVLDWNGQWVDSFELYQDYNQQLTWYSDWRELSTWLDCRYPDYLIEFVAYDWLGGVDAIDVVPATY